MRSIIDALPSACRDNSDGASLLGILSAQTRLPARRSMWRRSFAKSPATPGMLALMQRCVNAEAGPDESLRFGALWQDRVRRILIDHGEDPAVFIVRRAGSPIPGVVVEQDCDRKASPVAPTCSSPPCSAREFPGYFGETEEAPEPMRPGQVQVFLTDIDARDAPPRLPVSQRRQRPHRALRAFGCEGGEPDPRHLQGAAVAASFRT